MFMKNSSMFSKTCAIASLVMALAIFGGCDKKSRDRFGQLTLKSGQGLGVVGASYKTAYVLSSVTSTDLNRYQIPYNNLNYYVPTTYSSNFDTLTSSNYATAGYASGSYGLISIVAIEDKTSVTVNNLQSLTNFQYRIPNYNSGITAIQTGQIGIVDEGVTEDSFINILPDGSSLLVSSPSTEIVTQFYLNENGSIAGVNKIYLRFAGDSGYPIKPTRFVASRNWPEEPYVFVATNRGVATLVFKDPSEFSTLSRPSPMGSLFGTVEPVSKDLLPYPTQRVPKVLDIAITADNKYVYASNEYNQIFFRKMEDLENQVPFSECIYQKNFPGLKLASIPSATAKYLFENYNLFNTENGGTAITGSVYDYLHSVGVLTPGGLFFINQSTPSNMLNWNKLYSLKPVAIGFHPSGKSALILTENYLIVGKFAKNQESGTSIAGQYLSNIQLSKGKAKEMAQDPEGKILAVVEKNAVSFFRLEDKAGIVSRGDYPTGIPGQTISVAIR